MSRLGRLPEPARAMVEALFDPGNRESAVEQLRQCGDPMPIGHRTALAGAFERLLLPHVELFIHRLYASGRGTSAVEFPPADALRATGENVVRLLRMANDGPMAEAEAHELAGLLDAAWLRFVAEAAAHRMYADLLREDAQLSSANDARAAGADARLIAEFRGYVERLAKPLHGSVTPDVNDLAKRFKRAKRLSERKWRRFRQLLKAGRIHTP